MTREEFLLQMDEMLELSPGTLNGQEQLKDLAEWNSMAMIGYMALADTNDRTRIRPRDIAACTYVNDLLELAGFRNSGS